VRIAFFKALENKAKLHDNIYLLTGDLGFKLFDDFRAKYPDRFFDIGVAESNMSGIAAGLSLSGKNVYCYSIIPFLIMRAYEHIRNDIAYHNLNVKLIGAGGGFTYGLEGFTHYGLEDLAIMRMLPNMAVVVPADPKEAVSLAEVSVEYEGPIYIRLGRTGEPAIHSKAVEFIIGSHIMLNEGKDIAIFAIGNMVYTATQVIKKLKQNGIRATLINMHTLKPLDKEIIEQIAPTHHVIFSVEEHYINGGLGSAIAEVLIASGFKGKFVRIGIPEKPDKHIGNADYLRSKYGLSTESIYERIMNELEKK
jgi:transketolase